MPSDGGEVDASKLSEATGKVRVYIYIYTCIYITCVSVFLPWTSVWKWSQAFTGISRQSGKV